MKKWQLIDLTRSFCILVVMAHHSGFTPPVNRIASFLWIHFERNGFYGVCLFFVVSGFLITNVLAKGRGGLFKPDFRKFYVQRAGRIIPLLILVVSIGAICTLFFQDSGMRRPFWGAFISEGYNFWFWLALLTFSFNYLLAFQSYGYLVHWAVLWSLSVEEQFYVFSPLVLRKLGNDRNLFRFLVVIIFISFLVRAAFFIYDPQTLKRFVTCMMLFDQIAVGVLLYLIYSKFQNKLSDSPGLSFFVSAAGLLLLIGIYFLTSVDNAFDLIGGPILLAFGLFGFLLGGLHLSFFDSKLLKLFSLPGKYCYGGYLIHSWVLHFLRHPLMKMNPFLGFALFALVTTVISGISYHFFEMPANQMIRAKFGVLKLTSSGV